MNKEQEEIFYTTSVDEYDVVSIQDLLDRGFEYLVLQSDDVSSPYGCGCCTDISVTVTAMKEKP